MRTLYLNLEDIIGIELLKSIKSLLIHIISLVRFTLDEYNMLSVLITYRLKLRLTMKMIKPGLISLSLLTTPLTGCMMAGGNSTTAQNSVLVSELVAICGAIVGAQAEDRINQEWAKYPEAEVNRPVIEAVAQTLLNDPNASAQQRTSQYRQYLTCATGVLMTKGMIK